MHISLNVKHVSSLLKLFNYTSSFCFFNLPSASVICCSFICMFSHTFDDMEAKLQRIRSIANQVGIIINVGKIMRGAHINTWRDSCGPRASVWTALLHSLKYSLKLVNQSVARTLGHNI